MLDIEGILEFNVLGSRFPLERIMEFIGAFNVVRLNSRNCVSLPTDKDQVCQFLSSSVLPDTSRLYMLSPDDISKPMKYRFKKRIYDF